MKKAHKYVQCYGTLNYQKFQLGLRLTQGEGQDLESWSHS